MVLKVVLVRPGAFEVQEDQASQAGPGEAVVDIHRVGVCGSDIHAFHGRHPFVQCPRVLGHELAGTVVSVPDNDRGIGVGDKVSVEPFRTCGKCHACQNGKPNCCESMQVIGLHRDGGMRTQLAVPVKYLHRSDLLSHDQLATIEPLSIGAHGIERGGIQKGQKVLIVGAGPIGLACLQFAMIAGGDVTVAEVQPERRRFVEQCFDVPTVENPGEPGNPGDRCFDVVVDATGHPKAMEQSFHYVHHGGKLVFVGVIKAQISFDDALFHAREITLYASRNSYEQFPRIIKLIEDGVFDPTSWITHRMPMDQMPDLFADVVTSAGAIKAMIESA